MLVGIGGGAGGDEGKERDSDGDVDWFHWVMLRRVTEVGSGRKTEWGRGDNPLHLDVRNTDSCPRFCGRGWRNTFVEERRVLPHSGWPDHRVASR
jgi:hypothetical protein